VICRVPSPQRPGQITNTTVLSLPPPSETDKAPAPKVYQDPGEEGPYFLDPEPAVQIGDGLVLEADLPAHPDLAQGPYHYGPDGTAYYPDGLPGAGGDL
jgi:hypothetical protein